MKSMIQTDGLYRLVAALALTALCAALYPGYSANAAEETDGHGEEHAGEEHAGEERADEERREDGIGARCGQPVDPGDVALRTEQFVGVPEVHDADAASLVDDEAVRLED